MATLDITGEKFESTIEQVVDAVKALDMEEVHAHVARQREEAAAATGKPAGPQDGTQIPDA